MAVLEVIMIIIGLGAVFLSFKASDSNQSKGEGKADKEEFRNVSQEIKEALEKFDKDLSEKAEKIIDNTDDKLSTMLNEKIMGLSEYSQQILEKMENNHSETVFLYDMLNEKEKDIKELVNEADIAKANIRDEIANQYQELKKSQLEPVVNESDGGIPNELLYNNVDDSLNNSINSIDDAAINDSDSGDSDHAAMYDEEIAKIEEQERREKALHNLYASMGISGIDAAAIEADIEHIDHSDEIIELYNKGHSILDISKMLEIGQGEAKFVIDMYKAG